MQVNPDIIAFFVCIRSTMRLIRGLHNLRPEDHGCVATIGTFDGVHRGHQAVFRSLHDVGSKLGLHSTVITFEPQPMEFFRPDEAPARLTRLREKLQVLQACGIDSVLVLEFSRRLASMGAETFIDEILVRGLGVEHLYVGDDFRFGRARSGNASMLRDAGELHGFAVDDMDTHMIDGERVSSTRIRQCLADDDLETATELLGRPYSICGRVSHGDKRGRTIGFPTLNIPAHRRKTPLHGVYAVRVKGLGDTAVEGVANIGRRPTVDDGKEVILEVHLFNFDREVYGMQIEVEFVAHLRNEIKFDSFDDLKIQIRNDVIHAQDLHAKASNR
jgi:riboflavin kinase/FMN adenylyltransferase